ncbi:bifunctional GNAT family N-acetyltransferase/carbon-nitrogen hydrolase family protein [Psychrosphaera aquimarina]|uniref:Bifunctional GNAT family N-acetyltransferase/carbon-nitrogen hydrolase family protein n=1 Tax=Psychrosphaera aquimarina TaxID=2044854 RepID=A0ABU3QWX7_9GAMM|nr:bifunctional GNAT family N-acetyltransferase/carbon-nitrogen hydrolase family protein [Psychrosphaera aquimarina]MDU0111939.1 bifunctional GNAT family N-acetyltransferase/carbon-nitrogen hydrolase family protein [Psychrosphaera aquimarina]
MSENIYTDESEHKLALRHLVKEDYADLKVMMDEVYPNLGGAWPEKQFKAQLAVFPEGQICIEDHGKIVAAAFSLIVDYDKFGDHHTYDQITGDAYLTTHDPLGDVLYGIEVCVSLDYRSMRLGRRLYEARKELCQSLNLKSIIAGGRIPNYKNYAHELSPQKYIEQVKKREIYDPILTFQLSNDFEVKRVLTAYLPEDKESKGYATLLEWTNLYYDDQKTPLIGATKTSARIGCVQWQMRSLNSVEELIQQVEFFVDALSDYQCDLALLPEFFNAPLMGIDEHDNSFDSIKALAEYSGEILDAISKLAVSYNINIIAGSMPVMEDGDLYNVAYLCRRDGTLESQYKLHPTPYEKRAWIMKGGNGLNVFDTDFGRIGILICYDVEFPELARLQSEKGMQMLFVPFWTDTKNAYLRVRHCAHARAIENECYVITAGSVGNLPKVDGADIQYAQSVVFSPSDFSFPHDAIMAETTPNTEMTLIVDLDLTKLDQLKNEGSVKNYLDRRRDLYKITWIGD